MPILAEGMWRYGKLAVFDISEPGGIIAEKLLMLLSARQRQDLLNYLFNSQKQQNNLADSPCVISETYKVQTVDQNRLQRFKWTIYISAKNNGLYALASR